MKRLIAFPIALILLGLGTLSIFLLKQSNSQKEATCKEITSKKIVEMTSKGFQPTIFGIRRCTQVTFINKDTTDHWPASDLHPTHGIYPAFDPKKPISPQKSWSFVFNKEGAWHFHDHLFPLIYGTITVKN